MQLVLFYPRWGSAEVKWPEFLEKISKSGYQGVELGFSLIKKEHTEILSMLADFGMQHIGQHWQTKEVDFFTFAQNVELIELAEKIEQETGVPIAHETHRSRFAFAPHICLKYLKELPFIKLTADFAHWTCVAESLLENQEQAVLKSIEHTYHLHMRVGSSQSSQVQDPRDSNYGHELEVFMQWWMAILRKASVEKRPSFTLMPEQGPFPYGLYHENTLTPMTNQWVINEFIKNKVLEEWRNMGKFKSE